MTTNNQESKPETGTGKIPLKRLVSRTFSSDEIGPLILKILGISVERCREAQINIKAGHAVTVDVEYFASMDINPNTTELETMVKKFSLVEVDG